MMEKNKAGKGLRKPGVVHKMCRGAIAPCFLQEELRLADVKAGAAVLAEWHDKIPYHVTFW